MHIETGIALKPLRRGASALIGGTFVDRLQARLIITEPNSSGLTFMLQGFYNHARRVHLLRQQSVFL